MRARTGRVGATWCRLCLSEAQLRNSHIFPEFFYRNTYDETHTALAITRHSQRRPQRVQKGFRERLLCGACEGLLSRHEVYAARLLDQADEQFTSGAVAARLANFDVRAFRLFGLSLIWRAHVSSLPAFNAVRLGPHAEPLREMIHAEEPGEPHEYGFALTRHRVTTHGDVLVAPMRVRYFGARAYHFMARGYDWVFLVAGHADTLRNRIPFAGHMADLVIPFAHLDTMGLLRSLLGSFPNLRRD